MRLTCTFDCPWGIEPGEFEGNLRAAFEGVRLIYGYVPNITVETVENGKDWHIDCS